MTGAAVVLLVHAALHGKKTNKQTKHCGHFSQSQHVAYCTNILFEFVVKMC